MNEFAIDLDSCFDGWVAAVVEGEPMIQRDTPRVIEKDFTSRDRVRRFPSRGKIIVFATRTAGSCARRRTRSGRRSSDCTARLLA